MYIYIYPVHVPDTVNFLSCGSKVIREIITRKEGGAWERGYARLAFILCEKNSVIQCSMLVGVVICSQNVTSQNLLLLAIHENNRSTIIIGYRYYLFHSLDP